MPILAPKIASVTAASNTGFLVVADNTGFSMGAIVWLYKSGVTSVQCQIVDLSVSTLIGVRLVNPPTNYGFSDVSAFDGGGAFISQDTQLVTGAYPNPPSNTASNLGAKQFTSIGVGTPPTTGIKLLDQNILVESSDSTKQNSFTFKTDGIVGTGSYASKDPVFYVGKMFVGGIGSPELQIKYSDTGSGALGTGPAQSERSIFEIEKTGTLATVSDDSLRAHYEAYTHGFQNGHSGAYKPVMRLSSYPYMQFQAGPACSLAAPGMVTRVGTTITVDFTAGAPFAHGFSTNDPIYMTGSDTGLTMSEGTLVVTGVPTWHSFTYEDVAATAAANTYPVTFTIEPDVTVGRADAKTLDIRCDAVNSPNTYSLRVTPSLVQTPSTVTLGVLGPVSANSSVGVAGEVLTSQGAGLPPVWGAGGGGGGGHVIENNGTPVTQRANLNFTGSNVSVADEGGVKTTVTIGGNPVISAHGDSAGTPGDATLNNYAGRSAVANGATTCTITCNKLVAGSFVFVQAINNWGASAGHWITQVAGVSFTVNVPVAAAGDLYFDWHIH